MNVPNDVAAPATAPEGPSTGRVEPGLGSADTAVHLCPECGAAAASQPNHLYAIGRLEARFPSVGVEREFQQRAASMPAGESAAESRRAMLRHVLEANPYLGARMCYVLMVSGYPAYIVTPSGAYLREALFTAIGDGEKWCAVIGRVGPMAGPGTCQGVLAPMALANQIYAFSIEQWQATLRTRLQKALDSRKVNAQAFDATARDLFERIIESTENLGVTDGHRALNYALLQHPGIFLAAVERVGTRVLERIETRLIRGPGPRRIVAIVLTFLDMTTGVPERLFCRIDVTEEWPFVAGEGAAHSSLGLMPFVENDLFGLAF
jgi:hypothetical protein